MAPKTQSLPQLLNNQQCCTLTYQHDTKIINPHRILHNMCVYRRQFCSRVALALLTVTKSVYCLLGVTTKLSRVFPDYSNIVMKEMKEGSRNVIVIYVVSKLSENIIVKDC